MGKSMTWDSSSGMAMCQALYVLPRKRMSSEGIFGCGWLSEMPSSSACRYSESLHEAYPEPHVL